MLAILILLLNYNTKLQQIMDYNNCMGLLCSKIKIINHQSEVEYLCSIAI